MTKRVGPRIDKTALAIGLPKFGKIDRTSPDLLIREPERVVDPAWRRSAQGQPCDVLGCDGDKATVVGAHFRRTFPTLPGAGGAKPHDGLIARLCARCHDTLDGRKQTTHEEMQDLKDRLIAGLLMQRYWTFQQNRGVK